MIRSEMITAIKETPLSPKHHDAPNRVSATPPTVGPRTRATLNWMEFSAIAFGRSSVFTRVGIRAE